MSGLRVLMLAAAVIGVASVAVVGWRAVEQPPSAVRRAPEPLAAVPAAPPAAPPPAPAEPVIAQESRPVEPPKAIEVPEPAKPVEAASAASSEIAPQNAS